MNEQPSVSVKVLACERGRINRLILGTWNIKGMTDTNLIEITSYMANHSIMILAIQETRRLRTDRFVTDDGSAVFLSGSTSGQREWAGVGFTVAPSFSRHIIGFKGFRVGWLASSCKRAVVALGGTVCMPRQPLPDIRRFYAVLGEPLSRSSSNGPKFICGDLNARMGQRKLGEESILGCHCYRREAERSVDVPNRDL